VKRRTFIAGLGGAAAWPLVAGAQQAAKPTIGVLDAGDLTSSTTTAGAVALREGLNEMGYVEGQNLKIEYRTADGRYDRLPVLAAELVRRKVDAVFADAVPAAHAAQAATTTIPIVFLVGGDPVREGLVTRLNRPERNLTGVTAFFGELTGKRLQLLRQLVPAATVIGVVVNVSNPNVEFRLRDLDDAARSMGQHIQVVEASSESDFDTIFATLVPRGASALLVGDDPLFGLRREQLVALAARHAVPAGYSDRRAVAAGGLMSYGPRFPDIYRQVGIYVGRILQGAKPADLPVVQPTKFEFVINLKTAKALGLTIPETLLATADEVIQ
jgi:putative tryptophan/tyrosine transport system substrate-binding protein